MRKSLLSTLIKGHAVPSSVRKASLLMIPTAGDCTLMSPMVEDGSLLMPIEEDCSMTTPVVGGPPLQVGPVECIPLVVREGVTVKHPVVGVSEPVA